MAGRRFRNVVFKVHAWLGVHLFALLTLLSLTGTLLIYIQPIEAALFSSKQLEPPVSSEERPSFGTLYDQAKAHLPDGLVTQLIRSETPWIADKAIAWLPGGIERHLWFGGEGWSVSRESGPVDGYKVLRELHDSLLTRNHYVGVFVSALSIVLLTFMVTGLITYRRFWRGFFRLPSRQAGPRAFWGGLHRLTALWSLPFLIVITLTSLYFLADRTLPFTYQNLDMSKLTPREAILPEGFDGGSVDKVVEAVEQHQPDLHISHIYLPGQPHEAIIIFGETDVFLTNYEANRVLVDPATLAVVDSIPADELNMAHRAGGASEILHFGHFGGEIVKALWAIFGTIATVLTFAGAMVYAARTASPEGGGTAMGRIWSASVLTKLAYPLFFIGVIAVAVLRFA